MIVLNTRQRLTVLAHDLVRPVVRTGDYAIDATAGNGHDTLFLRKCVGHEGEVHAFDVQPEAIDRARSLVNSDLGQPCNNVHWHCQCHSGMRSIVPDNLTNNTQVIMFNLGYLPGDDHTIKTCASTTQQALEQALHLLTAGGALSVLVYTGHDGGKEELALMLEFCAANNESNDLRHIAWTRYLSEQSPDKAPQLFFGRKHHSGQVN